MCLILRTLPLVLLTDLYCWIESSYPSRTPRVWAGPSFVKIKFCCKTPMRVFFNNYYLRPIFKLYLTYMLSWLKIQSRGIYSISFIPILPRLRPPYDKLCLRNIHRTPNFGSNQNGWNSSIQNIHHARIIVKILITVQMNA